MSQFRISDENRIVVAGIPQRIVHLLATRWHYHPVLQPVKDHYGDVFHGLGVGGITAAADGDGCRKPLRLSLQRIPDAEAAHGEAAKIDMC